MCGKHPAANVLVKLMDEDDCILKFLQQKCVFECFSWGFIVLVGIDDKMAEVRTNSYGDFLLDGEESEVTPVDPKLEIFHDCNDGLVKKRYF